MRKMGAGSPKSPIYQGSWPMERAENLPSQGQNLSHFESLRIGWIMLRRLPFDSQAFDDQEETRPRMLARIAKRTGLKPEDLCPPHTR